MSCGDDSFQKWNDSQCPPENPNRRCSHCRFERKIYAFVFRKLCRHKSDSKQTRKHSFHERISATVKNSFVFMIYTDYTLDSECCWQVLCVRARQVAASTADVINDDEGLISRETSFRDFRKWRFNWRRTEVRVSRKWLCCGCRVWCSGTLECFWDFMPNPCPRNMSSDNK